MILAKKVRLYPTKRQEQKLWQSVGSARFIYRLKALATCSDGKVYKNINDTYVVRKIEKKLRRLQRPVSFKYENNKKGKEYVKISNIIKLEKKIQLMHRKLSNIRNNYLHQTTTSIVKAE